MGKKLFIHYLFNSGCRHHETFLLLWSHVDGVMQHSLHVPKLNLTPRGQTEYAIIVDPDEAAHYERSNLDLQCLHSSL